MVEMVFRFVLLGSVLCSLMACSVQRVSDSRPSESPAVEHQELKYRIEAQKSGQAEIDSSQSHPAVTALLNQAKQSVELDDYNKAEGLLERALRIAPKDPQVHYQMASLRLLQGRADNALQMAFKGKSLLHSDSQLAREFWRLIGDCYVRLGNTDKASEAYSNI